MSIFYPSSMIRKTLGRSRYELSKKFLAEFIMPVDHDHVHAEQLRAFNASWEKARRLPFYQNWQANHDLPDCIGRIRDLADWPVLTKIDLRQDIELVNQTPNVVGYYRTSGSTSQPFAFPRGEGEFSDSYASMWSYRSAHGLRPFDPFLAVSNISTGAAISRLTQRRNRLQRIAKDLVGNSWRCNGFVATVEEADAALSSIRFFRTKYLAGYTSGIVALARRAQQRELDFPYLTHAILTSETIDQADIELVESALKVTVLIEYGAVEFGVVAATTRDQSAWPLDVLWWSNLLRLDHDSSGVVTTLGPRVFPLINYATGDAIHPTVVSGEGSVLQIGNIEGRVRDVVEIATRDGGKQTVSAREITTLVRDFEGIDSVQIAQVNDGCIELYVVAPSVNHGEMVRRMSDSLMRNKRGFQLDSVRAKFIDIHIVGARGKRGIVVDEQKDLSDRPSYSLIVE